jgi:hypothetical protein
MPPITPFQQPAPAARKNKSLSLQLTDRDLRIFDFFTAIRFAETSHFAAALVPTSFPTEEKLRRRLRKFAILGYLDRPAKRIAPARETEYGVLDEKRERGRPEDIWALAQRGANLLKLKGDWNRNNGRLRPSSFPHPLMITRVYTMLRIAAAKGLISLDGWQGENVWRVQVPIKGTFLPLVPDAVFILSDNRTDREATIFLETDNNTEPLRRTTMVQSSFYKKCLAYWQYWADEIKPRHETMLVFTVAKTPERAEALRLTAQTIDAEGRGLNLFWFTSEQTWDISAPERFLYEPIWTTAAGERQALFCRFG